MKKTFSYRMSVGEDVWEIDFGDRSFAQIQTYHGFSEFTIQWVVNSLNEKLDQLRWGLEAEVNFFGLDEKE